MYHDKYMLVKYLIYLLKQTLFQLNNMLIIWPYLKYVNILEIKIIKYNTFREYYCLSIIIANVCYICDFSFY